jgi:diaminopimelate epimerase
MNINFIKMHGCGNDFLVIDLRSQKLQLTADKIRELADYKRSIGFDQLLLIENSDIADAAIRIFNNDGNEVSACGNGTRCVASLLFKEINKNTIQIATSNRILEASYIGKHVAVNMGKANVVEENLKFDNLLGNLVEVGNPHIIVNISDLDWTDLDNIHNDNITRYGSLIENDSRFPSKVNVNFVQVINRDLVYLRTWERGAGATLSCGTGSCATFASLHKQGLINATATIKQLGGNVNILMHDKELVMAGEAKISYIGIIEI